MKKFCFLFDDFFRHSYLYLSKSNFENVYLKLRFWEKIYLQTFFTLDIIFYTFLQWLRFAKGDENRREEKNC